MTSSIQGWNRLSPIDQAVNGPDGDNTQKKQAVPQDTVAIIAAGNAAQGLSTARTNTGNQQAPQTNNTSANTPSSKSTAPSSDVAHDGDSR